MSFSPFPFNNRNFSTLLDLESELTFSAEKNYLFDLSYLATIAVEGEKAEGFFTGSIKL